MTADVMEVPLTRGYVALVDAADYENVIAQGAWTTFRDGDRVYAQRGQLTPHGQQTVRLHTFLTGWPLVDHRNGDGLDNRRTNLRPATASQNGANQRIRSNNRSGFKGVSRGTCSWVAKIQCDYKSRYLGSFRTPESAARAYDRAALAQWGEFARTNFPREEYGS